MHMRFFLCALAIFLLTASALADIVGAPIDVELVHSGPLGASLGVTGGTHLYGDGDSDAYHASLFGLPYGSWEITSPPDIPAVAPVGQPIPEHLLQLDFTQFNGYTDFMPFTGTFSVSGLPHDVAPGSVTVFTQAGTVIGHSPVIHTNGDAFSVSWNGSGVIGAGLTDPVAFVGWTAVPAPGALALLSLAGLVGRPRRRRRG